MRYQVFYPEMLLIARFECAEATIDAGTTWLEGAALAFDSGCKIFQAPIIRYCVLCGSSSISGINLFPALHVQTRSTRSLLLLEASKLGLVELFFPLFCVCELLLRSLSIFVLSLRNQVDYVYMLTGRVSQSIWISLRYFILSLVHFIMHHGTSISAARIEDQTSYQVECREKRPSFTGCPSATNKKVN